MRKRVGKEEYLEEKDRSEDDRSEESIGKEDRRIGRGRYIGKRRREGRV